MDLQIKTPPMKVVEKKKKQIFEVQNQELSRNEEQAMKSQNERKPGEKSGESSVKGPMQICALQKSMAKVLDLNPVVCLSKIDVNIAKKDPKAESKFPCVENPIRKKKNCIGNTRKNVRKTPSLGSKDCQSGVDRGKTLITVPALRIMAITEFSASDFFQGVCRVCSEESDKCAAIFNEEKKLDHLINKFLPIFVTRDDDQPSTICKSCLTTLFAVNNLSIKCSSKAAQPQSEETKAKLKLEVTAKRRGQTCIDEKQKPVSRYKTYVEKKKINDRMLVPSSSAATLTNLNPPQTDRSQSLSSSIEIIDSFSLAEDFDEDRSKIREKKSLNLTNKPAVLSTTNISSNVSATYPANVRKKKSRQDDLPSSEPTVTPDNQKKMDGRSAPVSSIVKTDVSIIDCNQKSNQEQSQNSPSDLPIDTSFQNDDSDSNRTSPTKSKIIPIVSRDVKVNKKALGALFKQRKYYREQVSCLKTRLKSKTECADRMPEQEESARGPKRDITKMVRKRLRSKVLRSVDCKGEGRKKKDDKEEDENEKLNTALKSFDHDVTKLLDIGDADKHAAVVSSQKILQLTKKCLKVKVLLPSSEAAKKQDMPNILQLPSKDFKQVIETSVEVYSNTIRDTPIPVYYRILTESFPSEKIKQTISSTIVDMLNKRRKDALTQFEQNGVCTSTIFKRFEVLLKLNKDQDSIKCVECDKMLPFYEILSHIKFVHMYQCSQCKVVRHSRDALYHHTYSMHSRVKKCAVCNRMGEVDKCDHYFNCSVCNQGFFKYEAFMQHEEKHIESDFKALLYLLEPSCRDSVDLLRILDNFRGKSNEICLLDYFWDTENLPRECFLTLRDKLFCIRCFKMYMNTFVFRKHVCSGEDMYLRVNFSTLVCVKCDKLFKTRSLFMSHYMECIDAHFEVVKALSSNSYPVKIKCALCLVTFQNFGEFNSHTKSCFNVNLFYCNTCRLYVVSTVKWKHLAEHSRPSRDSLHSHQLSAGKHSISENGSKAHDSEETSSTIEKGQENTSSSTKSIVAERLEDIGIESVDKLAMEPMVLRSNTPAVPVNICQGNTHTDSHLDEKPESKTAVHCSTVSGKMQEGVDTLIADLFDDFIGIPSSTPLSKKVRTDSSEKTDVDTNDLRIIAETMDDLVSIISCQKPTDDAETSICCRTGLVGESENQTNSYSMEETWSAEKLESTKAICGLPRVMEKDVLTLSSSSNNHTKIPERVETDSSHPISSINNKESGNISQSYVRKRFTVKILTKPSVEEVGVYRNQPKFIENQDPNTNNALIEFLKDSSETSGMEGKEDSKLITVSYSIFYTEKDGQLFPHHFRLATSNLPQATREKALSVIRTLMRKENSKRIEEASKRRVSSVNQSIAKTYSKKFLKDPQQNNHVSGKSHETVSSSPRYQKISVTSVSSCTADNSQATSLHQGSKLSKCHHCEKFFRSNALLEHCKKMHMVQCETCHVFLSSSNELLNHRHIVHDIPYVICTTCFKKFGDDKDVHSCTHEFNCSMCSKKYHNWLEYLDHELIEFCRNVNDKTTNLKNESGSPSSVKSLMFPCKVCGRRYSELCEVENCGHNFKCHRCKNLFNNYQLLQTHGCGFTKMAMQKKEKKSETLRKIRTKIIYTCPLCEGRFDSQNLYCAHYELCADIADVSSENNTVYSVKCAYCSLEFDAIPLFHRHHFDCLTANAAWCKNCEEHVSVRTKDDHAKECSSEVLCDNCGVSFNSRTRYNLHLRQQLDGTVTCKNEFQDMLDGPNFKPDADRVAAMIRDKLFDLKNCTFCGKIFGSVKANIRHIKSTHFDLSKSCPVCRVRVLKSSTAILSHRKIHSVEEITTATMGDSFGTLKCKDCPSYFSSSHHKLLHEIYHHGRQLYQCSNCNKDFVNQQLIESHLKRCTIPKKRQSKDLRTVSKPASKYKCKVCDEPFESIVVMKQHLRSHGGRVACEICDNTFLSRHIMRDHQRRKHFGTPSTCEICGVEFQSLRNLKEHQKRMHQEKQPVICEVCGSAFKTQKHLNLHKTIHSGVKPYSCDVCGMKFRLRANLCRHLNMHSKEKTFICQYCPAKFVHPNTLQLHQRGMHPEKYLFRCKSCNYGFNDETFYNKHVDKCKTKRIIRGSRFKNGERGGGGGGMKCPYCNEEFMSLRGHFLGSKSDDAKTYKCKTCPKKFSHSCALRNHEQRHLNNNKYRCRRCGESFLGLKQHTHHMQLKHNDCFPLHCSHCSRGYNENVFYSRHIKKCNEFTQAPKHGAKSKKLVPRCTLCDKVFIRFSDLNVHSAIVHKSMSYKRYQCQICNSMFASSHLLVKHLRYHFTDRVNLGMFSCPKCKLVSEEFNVLLNHDCPFVSAQTESTDSNGGKLSFQQSKSPVRKRCKVAINRRPRQSKSKKSKYETEDEEDFDDSKVSDDERSNDKESVEADTVEGNDFHFEDYDDSDSDTNNQIDSSQLIEAIPVFKGQVSDEKIETDDNINSRTLVKETESDTCHYIYHCSFCNVNFDTLLILQNHLHSDHRFDLSALEFQVV